MKKNNLYLEIIILGVICFFLIFGFIKIMTGNVINFEKATKVFSDSIESTKIKEINIENDFADIEFVSTNDSDIKLELYLDKQNKYTVNTKNDVYYITNKRKNELTGNLQMNNNKIKVFVPKTYNNNIAIKLNMGDVKFDTLKSLNVNSNMGDVKGDKIDNITAHCSLGNIKISKVNRYLNLSIATGDVKIEKFNIGKDSKIDVDLGDIKIINTDAYVDAKNSVGDTKINNNNKKSKYDLVITNDVGDIKINY